MPLFKCKMCGGDLEIAEGITIAECEYCGTKQTVPKAMDENLQNLFNRANTLRIKSEFDKAEKLYEKIIQADINQADAYWGLILCKYGIEYVDDPVTLKKIPTCHRASYDSIIADEDYKAAIENADISQRAVYEEQAREIDRIQKDILALAQKEETYDVFICYKETDSFGQKTPDSVIANDIYYQLTNEGLKVFYAAITLEGKLGSAYEPIIFAALNSAKVMLVVGTKPEYFNAVWVKNEWSRFLKIIKKDRTKLLIPCYRDMDAYELPDEFAHLQAQNMSKIGFITDIVRGIKKVVGKDDPKKTDNSQNYGGADTNAGSNTSANSDVEHLINRAFSFLEYGDWKSADEYSERILAFDPENAQAYLVKLMISLHVRKREELKNCPRPFTENPYFKKTACFADNHLKATLFNDIDHIVVRNHNDRLVSKEEAELLNKAFAHNYLDQAFIVKTIVQASKCGGVKDITYDINKTVGGGYRLSMLHIACNQCNVDAVKYLIKLGIDVNHKSSYGATGLFLLSVNTLGAAQRNNAIEIARILLDNGAEYNMVNTSNVALYNSRTDPAIVALIKERYPDAQPGKAAACYIATCAYGSYDCPQVRTLRRYRDNTLRCTWYGRAFIRTYYAMSPTLVKWFGDNEMVKRLWRKNLDRIVGKLQSQGVESAPYDDRA